MKTRTKAQMIISVILIIAGAIFFSWCFFPQFFTANYNIGAWTGSGLGAVAVVYGIFMKQINAFISRAWRLIVGKCIIIAVCLIVAAILALACACIVSMLSAKNNKISSESATVIVLGCHVYSSGPSRMLLSRLNSAYDYLSEHPDSVCIVCGGQGDNEPCTESSAMSDYLTGKGIDPSRIIEDSSSLDTVENLTNAFQIIKNNGLDNQTVIVTNDFHLYRAVSYAEEIGFANPGTVSAPTLWWMFPSMTIREMYGILEMWFLN